jgi:hypothetical protein
VGQASVVTGERSWFGDAERRTRSMRVTPHPEEGIVTLSVWEGRQCTNTVRIAADELPSLIGSLAQALAVASVPPPPDPPVYLHVAPEPSVPVDPPAPAAPAGDGWIAPAPDPMSQWMHGRPAVDGEPTDPPVAPDPLLTAVSRAVSALGQGIHAVADTLTNKPPPPPPPPT